MIRDFRQPSESIGFDLKLPLIYILINNGGDGEDRLFNILSGPYAPAERLISCSRYVFPVLARITSKWKHLPDLTKWKHLV